MNAAVDRAIAQLKEARESLGRALDDTSLSAAEHALVRNKFEDVHMAVLGLSFASRRGDF